MTSPNWSSWRRNYRGGGSNDFICQAGEAVFVQVTSVALIEQRCQPGHYQGRSRGVSFPLGFGVRYRTGRSAGSYAPGREAARAIDVGTVFVTNRGIVFKAPKQTRECQFAKTISVSHCTTDGSTVVSVANRQKPMVIRHGTAVAVWSTFRMDLALAHCNGPWSWSWLAW
jgi:hypothetical protein